MKLQPALERLSCRTRGGLEWYRWQVRGIFRENVDSVRASTDSVPLHDVSFRTTPTLEYFNPVTINEVDKLMGSAPCKRCQLDPVSM